MDVVGAAASLLTIIEVSLRVAKTAKGLCNDIEGAPLELRDLSTKLQLVHALLQEIVVLRPKLSDGDGEFLSLDFRMTLATALEQTHCVLEQAKKLYRYQGNRVGVRDRLRWALLDKGPVEKVLVQVRHAQGSLMVALQLLQL